MKQFTKKCLSIFLAVTMLLSVLPSGSNPKEVKAAEHVDITQTSNEECQLIDSVVGAYAVLSGTLKVEGTVDKNEWPNVNIGITQEGCWAGKYFQILLHQNDKLIKLNFLGGAEEQTWDEVPVLRDQRPGSGEPLEKIFTNDGLAFKVVRFGSWAYFLVNTGTEYEMIGYMGGLDDENTVFTMYRYMLGENVKVIMSNITVASGMEEALAALDGMTAPNMKGKGGTTASFPTLAYFPIESNSWTLEGKFSVKEGATFTSGDNWLAYVGMSGWGNTIAVNKFEGTDYRGQCVAVNNLWTPEKIPEKYTAGIENGGDMYVRWVRNVQQLSLWVSETGAQWEKVVEGTLPTEAAPRGCYVNVDKRVNLTNVSIVSEARFPQDYRITSGSQEVIFGNYTTTEKYAVMAGILKSDRDSWKSTSVKDGEPNWVSTIILGTTADEEGRSWSPFRIYIPNSESNMIQIGKIGEEGYVADGISIPKDQWMTGTDLQTKLFSAGGLPVKLVRMDSWAYLLADMGSGYEMIGRMGVGSDSDTKFTVFCNDAVANLSSVSVVSGKEKTLETLKDMKMKIKPTNATYFPVGSDSWTIEGKLLVDSSVLNEAEEQHVPYIGANGWSQAISIAYNKDEGWVGKDLKEYHMCTKIGDEFSQMLTQSGLYVRWERQNNSLALWISVDGVNWTCVSENRSVSRENIGIYVQSTFAGAELSEVKIRTESNSVQVNKGTLRGADVDLSDHIGVNFVMELSPELKTDEGAYMKFSLPGDNKTSEKVLVKDIVPQTIESLDSTKQYYVFSCGIAAKEMASVIRLQMVDGKGNSGRIYTYRLHEDYAQKLLNSDLTTAIDKNLVKNMLNYGASAQKHFKYNTGNLANYFMYDTDKAIETPNFSADDGKFVVSDANLNAEGLTYYGTSLMTTTRTAIRHYFTLAEDKGIDDFTFTYVKGTGTSKELKLVRKGETAYYYVEIPEIYINELDQNYTLTVTKAGDTSKTFTVTSSAYSNIKVIAEGNTYSDESKNLMKSMYWCCDAAKKK